MTRPSYNIDDLLQVMARLRDPQTGCPWDLQQDTGSLAPFALEEAYEVVDAIERNDQEHLPEELGDLLFQVVFHARIGEENRCFDFAEVVDRLVAKLIARHPHVFPEGTLHSRRGVDQAVSTKDVNSQWERTKQRERTAKGRTGLLADIPVALPALVRAQKIQKRAAKVGFDWRNIRGVLAKVREEIQEFEEELAAGDRAGMADELGDLLFSLVNLARHLDLDAETALRHATGKFENRFAAMETIISGDKNVIADLSEEALDHYWRRAKLAVSGRG